MEISNDTDYQLALGLMQDPTIAVLVSLMVSKRPESELANFTIEELEKANEAIQALARYKRRAGR